MRFLVVFALVCAVSAAPSFDFEKDENLENGFEDLINKTLNAAIKHLPDPIKIPDFPELNIPEIFGIDGSANLTDFTIKGLKQTVASTIDIHLTSLTMTINIPRLHINFSNGFEFSYNGTDIINTEGANIIELFDLSLNVSGKVAAHILPPGVKVSDLVVLVHLGDVEFELGGLINNPELKFLIDSLLDDVFLIFLNEGSAVFSDVLGKLLEDIINGVLFETAQFQAFIEEFNKVQLQ